MSYTPDVCYYHDHCHDGFGAACVVLSKWRKTRLIPINYGEWHKIEEHVGEHVLIVDFSFPSDRLDALLDTAASVIVLDHHKTAAADLAFFPHYEDLTCENALAALAPKGVAATFDMSRSGARMAWDFCYPGTPPLRLILDIEDRDLWKFERPNSRLVHLYLEAIGYGPYEWIDLAQQYENAPDVITSPARILQRFYDGKISEFAATATLGRFAGSEWVPIVHVPHAFVSDTCHLLLDDCPDAPFAVAIVRAYGGVTYSLRSRDDRADVSEIARRYGGGGHRNAAGFRGPM